MAKTQTRLKRKKNLKFLWAVLAIVLFPLGFNIYGMTVPKRYTAEMRLMVNQSNMNAMAAAGPFYYFDQFQMENRPRSAQTQLDTLTGTTVLESAYQLAADRMPDKIARSDNRASIYDNLVRRLSVDNEPMSDVLSIKVTEDDPAVAAELANDIGLAYIENTKKVAREDSELLTNQLKEQTAPLVAKLSKIDAQISDLKRKSNIYDIGQYEANAGSTKEAADRNVATALANYDGSKAQLAVAEAELKVIPHYVNSGSSTQLNPVLVSVETQLAAENVSLAQLKSQYQDSFPLVKEEVEKIADLRSQLKNLKQSVPSQDSRSINPVYQGQESLVIQLRSQVQANAGQLAAAQQEQIRSDQQVSKIPVAEQQLQSLLRDRTTYEQTYEQLAQRETTAIKSLGTQKAPADIVSPALPPTGPSFPDKKLLTLTGTALGIFFAVLILMPRPEVVTEVPESFEPARTTATPAEAAAVVPTPSPVLASEQDRTPFREPEYPKASLNGESAIKGHGEDSASNAIKRGGPQALARALRKAKAKTPEAEGGDAPALPEGAGSV
jgi:succinoglycan biosynthesis transport protein ExoP